MMRNFLFGVGGVISGIFCVIVNPTGMFGVGSGLISTGILYMWNAADAMITDNQEKKLRLLELEQIKKQIESNSK